MLACFPIGAYVLIFLLWRTRGRSWREALIDAAVVYGVLAAALTEGLSVVHAVGQAGIAVAWAAVDVCALVLLVLDRKRLPRADGDGVPEAGETWLDGASPFLASAIGFILAAVGLTALLAGPNNWDSMVYHMPRIVHWLHYRSVAFFPTHIIREVHMAPFAEYLMLQFHAAAGADYLDNLVQWFSLGGCVVAVSLIAKILGAGVRGQLLAGLLSASIPEGILEASGANNDYVIALGLAASLYYFLLFRTKPTVQTTVLLGASAGLALLTKGTAPILGGPIAAVMLLTWNRAEQSRLLKKLPIILLVAVSLNVPQFWRNWQLFHAPLGPGSEVAPVAAGTRQPFSYSNDGATPPMVISNILRNLALHLGGPSNKLNSAVEGFVVGVDHFFGEDPNDPRNTWDGTSFHVTDPPLSESAFGNGIHLGIFLLAAVLLVWRRPPGSAAVASLGIGIALAFLAFCVVLKWQPWHTRLHLPLFVLAAAFAGPVLSRIAGRFGEALLAVLLLASAAPVALENSLRPLLFAGALNVTNQSRAELAFMERRDIMPEYVAAAAFVNKLNCNNIGIEDGSVLYEYPLLFLLGDLDGRKNIREYNVRNVTKAFADPGGEPCAVICPNQGMGAWQTPVYTGRGMTAHVFQDIVIFVKSQQPSAEVRKSAVVDGFENFGEKEGPYPEMNLPEVRWALGPKASFNISGAGAKSQVNLVARSNVPGETAQVMVDGAKAATYKFSSTSDFETIRALLPNAPKAHVELTFSGWVSTKADPRKLAVLVRDITVTSITLPEDEPIVATVPGVVPVQETSFALPGDQVVFGDWNGNGKRKLGVFRKGLWILDLNGSAKGDDGSTTRGQFGMPNDTPVVGDWTGDGKTKVGVFRDGEWLLDLSATAQFKEGTTRRFRFGQAGDTPVVGDWNGDGKAKAGVFRDGAWQLDGDGSHGKTPGSLIQGRFGLHGDIPVAGDWNGNHKSKVGIFRQGLWQLDLSGSATWSPSTIIEGWLGLPGDTPIVGDWDGSGKTKVGVIRKNCWQVDLTGAAKWSPNTVLEGCTAVPGTKPQK